jgi:hypothetical protein
MFHRNALVQTRLDAEEASALLAGLIGEDDARPFLGRTDEKGFVIEEIKVYRTSFLPRVTGRYVNNPGGTDLHLTLRPHREVGLFLALWGIFLLAVSLVVLAFALPSRPERLALLALPAVVGFLTWYLSFRVFVHDCRWAVTSLEEALADHHRPA